MRDMTNIYLVILCFFLAGCLWISVRKFMKEREANKFKDRLIAKFRDIAENK